MRERAPSAASRPSTNPAVPALPRTFVYAVCRLGVSPRTPKNRERADLMLASVAHAPKTVVIQKLHNRATSDDKTEIASAVEKRSAGDRLSIGQFVQPVEGNGLSGS